MIQQREIQHLFLRAGFGSSPSQIEEIQHLSLDDIVNKLFEESKSYDQLATLKNPIKGRREMSNFRIALQLLRSREQVKELNIGWLDKMSNDSSVLREKMTLFWHGHFATKVPFAYLMQMQNNTLRQHALGNFRELLHAISKDPAMLIFLNNQQNKKNSPNENFARELLELFTLGEGNIYTEKDIKEAARAFTGWKTNKAAEFEFVERAHDFGIKEFMGHGGNFNGEDIIDIILDRPETATFIAGKIYKFFVNDTIDGNRVADLTKIFLDNDYDLSAVMNHIFKSDWFYDESNIGSKIISPVEMIVRYRRLFDIQLKENETWLNAQHILGQTLFNPPNVAGWEGGKNWIDSSSLLFRMNFAPLLFEYKNVNKWSDNKSDWEPVLEHFKSTDLDQIVNKVATSMIQAPLTLTAKHNIKKYINKSDPVKSAIIRTMMLPEFQLI